MASAEEIPVSVTSIYGALNKAGLVQITIGDQSPTVLQWSAEEARRIARLLMECAEGADTDEFLMGWLTKDGHMDQSTAAVMLREYRAYRKAKYGEVI